MASFVPEVQKTKPKKIRVKKSACKARLGKGHGFKIADCTDDIADKYALGLAWDVPKKYNDSDEEDDDEEDDDEDAKLFLVIPFFKRSIYNLYFFLIDIS